MKEKKIYFNKDGKYMGKSKIRYDIEVTDKEIDYNKAGAFLLMANCIEGCFKGTRRYKEKIINRNFAVNSIALKMFCDASENFEINKIRKRIFLVNK